MAQAAYKAVAGKEEALPWASDCTCFLAFRTCPIAPAAWQYSPQSAAHHRAGGQIVGPPGLLKRSPSNAVRHLALSYDRRRRGRSLSLAHVLRTASDAQESEHRVTAPITAATCNFARSRLVITANLPAPRASRRASDARQRVNSFGGLAILAAIRRARSGPSRITAARLFRDSS